MIFAIIPVFNRLALTQRVLECLRTQTLSDDIHIVVVDDGSSDGTAEFLKTRSNVTVLHGDGSLWWGGAINVALRHVLLSALDSDWVLFINNDTQFDEKFVQRLIETGTRNAPAAVGTVICDENATETVLSIGPELDTWRLKVHDKLKQPRSRETNHTLHEVDALSGRGTLYPMAAIKVVGTMRPRLLPHYLADYEFAVRVRKAGYALIVTEATAVFSADDYGNSYKSPNIWEKFFSVRSPYYLPASVTFWWSASNTFKERLTLIPRLFYIALSGPRSSP